MESSANERFRNLTILCIEDDALQRQILSSLLAQRGLQVRCAKSVQEAEKTLRKSSFDLVVSDFSLPDGDVRSLFELGLLPSRRTIVISASYHAVSLLSKAVVLQKPANLRLLWEWIEQCVDELDDPIEQ